MDGKPLVKEKYDGLMNELRKVIVGQDEFLEQLAVALFTGGHVLIEGVPGIGKTLAARALARTLKSDFSRIQFTPDLLPSDVTGTKVFDVKNSAFYVKKGPVFTNILLADEINRATPKTQSALLECMEEGNVTIDGETYELPKPFMVLATMNPLEFEGTYPLPEAQLDRFLMKLKVRHLPPEQEEVLLKKVNESGGTISADAVSAVIDPDEWAQIVQEINRVFVNENIIRYITSLIYVTRTSHAVLLGASSRASIALLKCAKTVAAISGRDFVIPEDVTEMVKPVLRHRIIVKPETVLGNLTVDDILDEILRTVEVPR
ncbi:ATPase associated with various cellular activities [Thermoclostridium stercorarium subsp. stercorarium DSM 8532]|jgi:MoxR-like ATPase|uniref:ATPase associated with various cellular activities n=2 Tax=Thermoclostridium stercorarium TaxID=1510 RepID=L7VRB8_THES1|nr:MoxR family ATPase [Thermoclostridium stercorarium]AGC69322.1 ATPase associated with various cellular activities [Thermoclostridium stercorarium subsp. stercorarium DSM 8532]AGI40287.1 ATPase [Thermoclostridium stercorarium subsp. stercorarium DSM 8532]ANW99584.1 magnesium chelatase [Thermoclostridium stercorarium subsp. thermolacticum DSM 2910]